MTIEGSIPQHPSRRIYDSSSMGAYLRGYKGIYTSRIAKISLDLRMDAEYVNMWL